MAAKRGGSRLLSITLPGRNEVGKSFKGSWFYHLEKFALPISGWQTDCLSLPRDVLDKGGVGAINGLMSACKFHTVAKVNSIISP